MKSLATVTIIVAALAATPESEDALSLLQTAAVKQHEHVTKRLPDNLWPRDQRPCGSKGERPGHSRGPGGFADCLYMGQYPDIEQTDAVPPQGTGEPLENSPGGKDNIRTLPDPKKRSKYFNPKGAPASIEIDLSDKDAVDFQCKGGKGKWFYTGINEPPGAIDLTYNYGKVQSQHLATDTGFKHNVAWKRLEDNTMLKDPETGAEYGSHRPQIIDLGPVKDEKECHARAVCDPACIELVETDTYQRRIVKDGESFVNPDAPFGNVMVWYNTIQKIYRANVNRCMCGTPGPSVTKLEPGWPGGNPGTWACQLSAADIGLQLVETAGGLKVGDYPLPQCGTEAPIKSPPMAPLPGEEEEPKEKKTPEQRAACKAAKSNQKAKRSALSALRQQLKDLRAQFRAAKDAFKEAKTTRKEAC